MEADTSTAFTGRSRWMEGRNASTQRKAVGALAAGRFSAWGLTLLKEQRRGRWERGAHPPPHAEFRRSRVTSFGREDVSRIASATPEQNFRDPCQ